MRMEVEAITKALEWMTAACPRTTHTVLITDSMSTLKKIEKGFLRREWMDTIRGSPLRSLTWIFCPGHAGVGVNEEADRLAGDAPLGDDFVQLDRHQILQRLSQDLIELEERETDGSHYVERMKELGIQRGSGKHTDISGNNRRISNQILTGTISRHTLNAILERGTEHLWTCPECNDVAS